MHLYFPQHTHTYMYDRVYMYISGSPTILLREGCEGITHLNRQATHVTFTNLIISQALCINFNQPALTYYLTYYGGTCEVHTTKAYVFTQWITTMPPGELTGPWNRRRSITAGPGGHLRRGELPTIHKTINLFKTQLLGTSVCALIPSGKIVKFKGKNGFLLGW